MRSLLPKQKRNLRDAPRSGPSSAKDLEAFRLLNQYTSRISPENYATVEQMLIWTRTSYLETYEEIWLRAYRAVVNDKEGNQQSNDHTKPTSNAASEDVDTAVTAVETTLLQWGSVQEEMKQSQLEKEANAYTYKQIEVDGLPYLMRTQHDARLQCLEILRRRIDLLADMIACVNRLIQCQALLGRGEIGAGASLAAAARLTPPLAANVAAPPQRDAALSRFRRRLNVLSREDTINLVLSTLFLALKMLLLVYVITRGASDTKRMLITAAAGAYVTYDTYQRFVRQARLRMRVVAREAGRNQPAGQRRPDLAQGRSRDATGALGGLQTITVPADAPAPATPRSIPTPVAPLRVRTASPLLVEYWVERLAYYGLAKEDREMGFRVLLSGGRILPPLLEEGRRPQRYSGAWLQRCVHDRILLPLFLFVVTLVPEIEQRRRRAIDKRDALIQTYARKVEALETRLQREQEGGSHQANEPASSSSARREEADRAHPRVQRPLFLQTEYGKRLLQQQNAGGRQIDITQELEAAAALAAGRGAAGPDGAGANGDLDNADNDLVGEGGADADMAFI